MRNKWTAARHGMLGLAAGLALLAGQGALAKAPVTTMATLLDRIQIEDLLIDYYAQLGKAKRKDFGEIYTEDAEMVLGGKSIKGRAAIEALYASIPADSPTRQGTAFNMLLSNPRIAVHGNTATAEVTYTGIIADAPDKPPRLLEQGHEFDELVKLDGEWKIRKRTVVSDATPGAD